MLPSCKNWSVVYKREVNVSEHDAIRDNNTLSLYLWAEQTTGNMSGWTEWRIR